MERVDIDTEDGHTSVPVGAVCPHSLISPPPNIPMQIATKHRDTQAVQKQSSSGIQVKPRAQCRLIFSSSWQYLEFS